ncbi:hydroxyphenylpyruvate reductase-like protein [Tanacetum coccineum]
MKVLFACRLVERANIPVMYLLTHAAERVTGLLQSFFLVLIVDKLYVAIKELENFDTAIAHDGSVLQLETYAITAEHYFIEAGSVYHVLKVEKADVYRLPYLKAMDLDLVSGKSVGIIGLGRIGSAIAKRMETLGCPIR